MLLGTCPSDWLGLGLSEHRRHGELQSFLGWGHRSVLREARIPNLHDLARKLAGHFNKAWIPLEPKLPFEVATRRSGGGRFAERLSADQIAWQEFLFTSLHQPRAEVQRLTQMPVYVAKLDDQEGE